MVDADDPRLTLPERHFATRVRELREENGWNQADVADYMRRHGVPYANQSTVSRIEKGSRPVRMVEAQALSRMFSETVYSLMHPDSRDAWLISVESKHARARRAYVDLKRAAESASDLQESLRQDRVKLLELEADGLDPDMAALHRRLTENLSQLADISLVAEVKKIVDGAPNRVEGTVSIQEFVMMHDDQRRRGVPRPPLRIQVGDDHGEHPEAP